MSYVVQFLVVAVLALMGCVKVTLQGSMSRRHIRNSQDSIWFIALLFAAIAVCSVVLFPLGPIDGQLLLNGTAAGIAMVVFQVTYSLALGCGPVSLTVVIVACGVFIPTLVSAVIFGESIYPTQLAGIGFLLGSIILGADTSNDTRKVSRRWLMIALGCMCASGTASSLQKVFGFTQSALLPGASTTFVVVMYVSGSLLAFAFYFLRARTGQKTTFGFDKHAMLIILAIAVVLGLFQRLNMYSLTVIDGTFLFPLLAGLQSLGMTAIGILRFGDKISRRQWLGVACGILCVIMMNLRLGPAL